MSFVHDDREFGDLLRVVAQKRGLSPGLVEKDYWVTHTLWALHQSSMEIWFKGGTSLSKGFGLIERFSEDLDLKIEPGAIRSLPHVKNWKSEGNTATAERRGYFEKLPAVIAVPGAVAALDDAGGDATWRSANIRITYPGRHLGDLGGVLRPFVLLEVGSARVTPFAERDMTSFVHDELVAQGLISAYDDNRPRSVRCVHPLVTLLEKLDALHRRVPNPKVEPATFVRHLEDAARIVGAESRLPPLGDHGSAKSLALEMVSQKQIVAMPEWDDPAFTLISGPRGDRIQVAYDAIAPMYWGPRVPIAKAYGAIRAWVKNRLR